MLICDLEELTKQIPTPLPPGGRPLGLVRISHHARMSHGEDQCSLVLSLATSWVGGLKAQAPKS